MPSGYKNIVRLGLAAEPESELESLFGILCLAWAGCGCDCDSVACSCCLYSNNSNNSNGNDNNKALNWR